jgi:hypothetical protein
MHNATDLLTGYRCDATVGAPDGVSSQADLIIGPIKCPPGARILVEQIVRHPVDRARGLLVRHNITGQVSFFDGRANRSIDPAWVRAIIHADYAQLGLPFCPCGECVS